jgi:excisionase family DNA binding protein
MKEIRFMDISQLALYIHLSKSSIYKMIGSKRIPHHKIQSRLLFEKQEIDLWVLNDGNLYDTPRLPKLQ